MVLNVVGDMTLFAFAFAHPAMLAWLAAAAVPILIHLWSRRRYQETPWAAMEYLAAALRQRRRTLLFEHWLLLAIRTLVVALVVLAVAEPVEERGGLAAAPGERTHRVLVLDGSFSMGYTIGEKSRFEQAKELAARIVRASAPGDGFTLVLMSAPPRIVIGQPSLAPSEFLREVELLELPHSTADLPETLRQVEQVLLAARREQPRLTREVIYFVTDLGRVGWSLEGKDAATVAEFRSRSERLAEAASLVVIDVGQADAENVAVTNIRSRRPFATLTRDFEIEATLRSFPPRARPGQSVELWAEGRRVARQVLDLPAAGEAKIKFFHRFESAGDRVLEVRVPGDALEIDNRRWLAVPVKASVPVLCVEGRSTAGAKDAATRYLALALSPRPEESPLVRLEVVVESRLPEMELDRYECVFLADVAQFTSAEARLLGRYVAHGGNLVFFLGDRVQAERYQAELGKDQPLGIRLLPGQLGPTVDRVETRLDPLGYRHPVLDAFRGRERSGLLTVPVLKHMRLDLAEAGDSPVGVASSSAATARVVLALASGDPLVVEAPAGRGRVVWVTTSADTSWTYLPLWPSYVPLIQEMLDFLIRGQLERQNIGVGEPLNALLPATLGEMSLEVRDPRGRVETVRSRREDDRNAWSFAETWISGVYSVEAKTADTVTSSQSPGTDDAAALVRPNVFAVNVDPAESDLTPLNMEELRNETWPGVPFVHQRSWEPIDERTLGGTVPSNPWAKNLLGGVMVLLLVETFLARRFGHYD